MKVLCERSWYVVGVVDSWVCGSASDTSLLELTINETLPITPRPTRSPRTAQPPPRLAPATSAPTPTPTCRGACESDLLFPLEIS